MVRGEGNVHLKVVKILYYAHTPSISLLYILTLFFLIYLIFVIYVAVTVSAHFGQALLLCPPLDFFALFTACTLHCNSMRK